MYHRLAHALSTDHVTPASAKSECGCSQCIESRTTALAAAGYEFLPLFPSPPKVNADIYKDLAPATARIYEALPQLEGHYVKTCGDVVVRVPSYATAGRSTHPISFTHSCGAVMEVNWVSMRHGRKAYWTQGIHPDLDPQAVLEAFTDHT